MFSKVFRIVGYVYVSAAIYSLALFALFLMLRSVALPMLSAFSSDGTVPLVIAFVPISVVVLAVSRIRPATATFRSTGKSTSSSLRQKN
ncbi:MAG: hypothetical protein NTY38_28515 [Acidobacteria bacterium]|nr:hypothetical protein [Acidobacteriota bacterium]